MKLREDVNEYGTTISVYRCEDCGCEFTICPPAGENWGGCLAESCPSYDIDRDMDRLFERGDPRIRRVANC